VDDIVSAAMTTLRQVGHVPLYLYWIYTVSISPVPSSTSSFIQQLADVKVMQPLTAVIQ